MDSLRGESRTTKDPGNSHAKVALFTELFSGLTTVYGTYDPATKRSWQVKRPVTESVIRAHLTGRQPYGVYLLVGNKTRACVVDFDNEDLAPPREFAARAMHYGLNVYIERSKSKGYHAWVFFPIIGVPAAKARMVVRHILDEIGQARTEVFPKQNALYPSGAAYGNFINAPLFGTLAPQGRTVFVNPQDGFQPYPNQWLFLKTVVRVKESLLDDVIAMSEITEAMSSFNRREAIPLGVFTASGGLPVCARRMLDEGVVSNQRVSCFRLAVQLRRVGLPFALVVAALTEWSKTNRPEAGRRTITHWEVKAQAAAAFLKEYRAVGCEDPAIAPFCEESCPLRRK